MPPQVPPALQRLALLTGADGLDALDAAGVMVVGLGGVGSWCAEALARSGIGRLCLADSDAVCITNVNRQVHATPATVGVPKTEALRARLAELSSGTEISTVNAVFSSQNAAAFPLAKFDYIVDAIDSLSCKLDLIEAARAVGATLFSCMGMAQKLDPCRIQTAGIWQTQGCPLARLVRQGLRKRGFTGSFTAVYSTERLPLHSEVAPSCGSGACLCPRAAGHEWCSAKKVINGSAVTVTATAGMILASLVIQDILKSRST